MRFFIDTANLDEIKEAASWGVIAGVTTNPSLIAREGRDFKEIVKEICAIVDGPISAEVISLKADEMLREATELARLHKNIVIKLPITWEGLKACKALTDQGINTNVTLIFSANQALLAARAGATYVSPFVGRLNDISQDGISTLIKDIRGIFDLHNLSSQIIAASIRTPVDVLNSAKTGAHIATVPFEILKKLLEHPMTEKGIERFLADWEKVPKNNWAV